MSPQIVVPAATLDVPVTSDRTQIKQFLRLLWPEGPGRLYLCVWRLGGESRWFGGTANENESLAGLDRAADCIAANPVNTYVGMCLADADHGPHRRLCRKEGRLAFAAPGLWLDADMLGPGHRSTNLPESIEQVREILLAAGLARWMPTVAVHTGGGLHLHWLFKEPWIFESGSDPKFHDRDCFASILRRFQRLIREAASARGLAVDSTCGMEQVLRPAGTTRLKDGCAPVQTRFYDELSSGQRYNATDFEELLEYHGVPDCRERPEDAHVEVGLITVNPRVTIDPDQFRMMMEADPGLVQIWNLQRPLGKKIGPEDSFSERDAQLAGYLAYNAEFDGQRITDWAVYFRREKARPGHQRARHLAYYEITAGKALAWAEAKRKEEQRRQTAEGKKQSEAEEEAKRLAQAKRAALSPEDARAVLKDVLKREVTRMLVLKDNDVETYQIETDGQTVTIGGIAAIYSPELTSRPIWAATGRPLPHMSKKHWTAVVLPALHGVRVDVDLDADHGQIRRWLREWFWGTCDCRVCENADLWRVALDTMTDMSFSVERRTAGIIQVKPPSLQGDGYPGSAPVCILRAHRFIAFLTRTSYEASKETPSSIRKRLHAAGFVRKESYTVTVGDEKIKLRDVFVGSAAWWDEVSQDTVPI